MSRFHQMLLMWLFIMDAVVISTRASVIQFHAYPSELKTNLTTSLSMRCGLENTQVTNGQIGKRSRVTNTTDDVLHISSIVITRNGQEVASVTPFDPPTGVVDLGNLEVKGDVSGTSSEGVLEVSWRDPSKVTLGEYSCEINAIEAGHHNVAFTSTVELTSVTPSINDVITDFDSRFRTLNTFVNSLEQQLSTEKATVAKLRKCSETRVAFMAVLSASRFSGNVYTFPPKATIVFDKTISNEGGSYNNQTGQFIIKTSGMYEFNVHVVSGPTASLCLKLQVNTEILTSFVAFDPVTHDAGSLTAVVHLKVNDVVQVMDSGCDNRFYNRDDIWQPNAFTGHMLHSDDCLA